MTTDLAFECLLVSRDASLVRTVTPILKSLSISTELCLSSSKASTALQKHRTELVAIDWEMGLSSELVYEIWNATKCHTPTIMAFAGHECYFPGVHIVANKPLTPEAGDKAFRSAYSRMIREHRRHSRYSVMTTVQAKNDFNETVRLTVIDIGDGGIGLSADRKLGIGETLSFHLLLDGLKRSLYLQVRVLWVKDRTRAGCEFLRVPPVDLDMLQEWLKNRIRIKKPLVHL